MTRRIEEDWSHFNAAARRFAEGYGRPRAAPGQRPAAVTLLLVLGFLVLLLLLIRAAEAPRPEPAAPVPIAAPAPLPPSPPMPAPSPAPERRITREFTIFSTENLRADVTVTTGWVFRNQGDTAPFRQFCYVAKAIGAGERMLDLLQGSMRRMPEEAQRDFALSAADWARAHRLCRWFEEQPPEGRRL